MEIVKNDPENRLDGNMFTYIFGRFHNDSMLLNHLIYEMKFFRRDQIPLVDLNLNSSGDCRCLQTSEEVSHEEGVSMRVRMNTIVILTRKSSPTRKTAAVSGYRARSNIFWTIC
uniref:FBD domain-containing protein n=1 Tax=Caenorhabditis tropicalis TaxID=1561998 RepID=A0A1I7TVJ5_9PELO